MSRRYIPYPELSQKLIDVTEELKTVQEMLRQKQLEVEKNYFLFLIAGGTEVEANAFTYQSVNFVIKNLETLKIQYPNEKPLDILRIMHFRIMNLMGINKEKLYPRNLSEVERIEQRYEKYVDKMRKDV